MAPVVDATQRAEGDAKDWVNEPLEERHASLTAHTVRPFNAEPPNSALKSMITPKGQHYRRQHTPVPVVDEKTYSVSIGVEGKELQQYFLAEVQKFAEQEMVVTLMCTGNRRSEFNTEKDGETMGLPWKNGSISTARWTGCSLRDVLEDAGIDGRTYSKGYRFLTMYGLEDYHVSVPLKKVLDEEGDCMLAWKMNGETLPRDHGYPLRVIIPGFVGARSVKWIDRIVVTTKECDGMHQTGIAYKQLGPNVKSLGAVTKAYIEALPPIDHVPITSAITSPEPDATVAPGEELTITGYAYSGAGLAVIRVDITIDEGATWAQAEITRASEVQYVRSGRAWAWVQWKHTITVPSDAKGSLKIACKGVDDQYNQQPHEAASIWNLRGILNTSWGRVEAKIGQKGLEITDAAKSGDGSVDNVGIKMTGEFQCDVCRQRFDTELAKKLHWKFIHDPNRHQED
jgi:sulfite oxidase